MCSKQSAGLRRGGHIPVSLPKKIQMKDAKYFRSKQFLYDHVRKGPNTRPFCMTVSLTHPHDPYTIEKKYWDMYEDVDITLPEVTIPQDEQDAHSQRLLKVCDLWG